ncbi:hypothetical protein [Hyphomicrobium sp. CS1GBMeth3]|uniref:hypothetical protein n=1 Tax=Hyphomicrobium sp. CS1GBMeth3 TaxID=1892845 RepID=UPI000930B24A|nr:hypothetical protein [Hyphomicrobium sp. CS1GBMeth3]
MASILEFRQPAVGVRRATVSSTPASTADIVLFPGVRYERWAEAPSGVEKSRRRARSRDHLDLDD